MARRLLRVVDDIGKTQVELLAARGTGVGVDDRAKQRVGEADASRVELDHLRLDRLADRGDIDCPARHLSQQLERRMRQRRHRMQQSPLGGRQRGDSVAHDFAKRLWEGELTSCARPCRRPVKCTRQFEGEVRIAARDLT